MPFSRRLWRQFAPLIFLLLLWGGAFWRVLFAQGSEAVVFPQGDFYNHYYNFATYQVERWYEGQWPLWNPYNGAGDPFAANIQLNTFYPPRWFTALIWGGDGWQIADHMREGALHILLTSLVMYGFVRRKTQRIAPALIGAVLWSYGGYLMSYPLQQTAVLAAAIWLPLMLWGAWEVFQPRPIVLGLTLGSVGVGLSLLGGHPQTTLYMLYAMAAYGVYVGLTTLPHSSAHQRGTIWNFLAVMLQIALRLGVMVALGSALSAMQMLPALEFTRLSGRLNEFSYEQKAQGFLLADVSQILLPGLRGAMSPLYASLGGAFLALLTLFPMSSDNALPKRFRVSHIVRNEAFIWWLIGLVTLAIGLGAQTPLYALAYRFMPGIALFRQPERIALVVQFALVLLAVEGYQRLTEKGHRWLWRVLVIAFAIISLIGLAANWNMEGRDAWGLIALNAVLFAAWVGGEVFPSMWRKSNSPHRPIWNGLSLLLIALLTLDLLMQMRQSIPYVADTSENRIALAPILEQLRVPDSTQIMSRVDGAVGLRDDGLAFRVPNIYHAGPLSIATIEEIRHTPVDRFWEVLGVRYATLAIDKSPPTEWGLIPRGEGVNSTGDGFRLFELPDPRPLALLLYDSRDAGGDMAFAREIMSDSRIHLRDTAVTTLPLPFSLPGTAPALHEIRDVQFQSPESLSLTVSTEANALLSLSIPRYPGWQASVNGQPVEMVEVYGGLIGIPVQAARDQHVGLIFVSSSVEMGVLISAGAGLIVLIMGVWHLRRR